MKDNEYAISMKFKNGYGKANIKNTDWYFICRLNNVSVIHDVMPDFIGPKQNSVRQIDTTYLNLLKINSEATKPEWVNKINILDDIKIKSDIIEIERDIKKLEDKKILMETKLENNNEYKKLLYTSGDELVNIVKKVLEEMLAVKINDLDVKKEDLSFELDNKKILVEVKGINTSIKRGNVSQLRNHIEDNALLNNIEDDEISDMYKGILIINPYIKDPIDERIKKDFYSETVKSDIKHEKFFAIDTISLLSIYKKFSKGDLKNIKKYILENDFIGTDFSVVEEN